MAQKCYLGNNVYVNVEFGDAALTLTTENGLGGSPSNIIVLEPEGYAALVAYVKSLEKERAGRHLQRRLFK